MGSYFFQMRMSYPFYRTDSASFSSEIYTWSAAMRPRLGTWSARSARRTRSRSFISNGAGGGWTVRRGTSSLLAWSTSNN